MNRPLGPPEMVTPLVANGSRSAQRDDGAAEVEVRSKIIRAAVVRFTDPATATLCCRPSGSVACRSVPSG